MPTWTLLEVVDRRKPWRTLGAELGRSVFACVPLISAVLGSSSTEMTSWRSRHAGQTMKFKDELSKELIVKRRGALSPRRKDLGDCFCCCRVEEDRALDGGERLIRSATMRVA